MNAVYYGWPRRTRCSPASARGRPCGFFLRAGIAYPAGLPGFKGLVEKIYQANGTELSEIESAAFERDQFDATLDLLERRLPGQRLDLRRALAEALKPKLRRKGAVDTQTALLRLGRSRDGALRLVTTNFDRVFHVAAKRIGQAFESFAAPMLPVPKNSRWNGLVYLHGVLPVKVDDTALNRLVVTSGDFGLAYLTERWAARFVSELFRNYVVCFVGYSINDPVLRYMMDALAADRMLGEVSPTAWAFGDCVTGEESQKAIEWEAKGVTPILYNLPVGSHNHSALHLTLQSWADTYRDGAQGKEAIVVKHALARPQDSTKADNFVGRMLWALSDKSALPAKRFAEFNPPPSLDWLLESFNVDCIGHSDLARFDVQPQVEADEQLSFSLIRRPASYKYTQPMLLVSGGNTGGRWDDVMEQIARWLVRHLNDPRLVIWVAERGGALHERLVWLIENELDRFASLKRDGKTSELDEIRLLAPMAIPDASMCTLWRLMLSGRVKSPWRDLNLYRWQKRLQREGLTTTLRLELRDLLAPKIALKKPFRWTDDDSSPAEGDATIGKFVNCELVLAADHVGSALRDHPNEHWLVALPMLLEDLQQLLRDALDLSLELGESNEQSDHSHWDLPSITPHWQNRGYHDWVSLIESLRDAWIGLRAKDNARGTEIARSWFQLRYPTFKRLALFAASQDVAILPNEWVDWLLADDAWWLWSTDTRREVFRLFILQGRQLTGEAEERLESAILAGPPRQMYIDDLTPQRWEDIKSRSVWLHLSKLNASSLTLRAIASAKLLELSTLHPEWQLADHQRDEFSHWMSGTDDPDYEDSREVNIAPRKRHEILKWLKGPVTEHGPFYEDTWREVCRTRFFHSLSALCDLAGEDEWPAGRWRDALQTWAEDGLVLRSWHYAAALVQRMPDTSLQQIDHAVTWWMEAVSKSCVPREDIFLDICSRLLNLPLEPGTRSRIIRNGVETFAPVSSAINHPIGHVTQALLNLWFKRNPNDNDLLPFDIGPYFTKLCDLSVGRFRHGRVLLGSRLIAFFRVDRTWTERCLLPLFDWNDSTEASDVWEGFLWSPRLYQPLLAAFKSQFLETAKYYSDLGEHRRQFAAFLTYVALEPSEEYAVADFRVALSELPQSGLEESAQALSQAVEGAGDQREDYWKNRAQPFWHNIWPKSRTLATAHMADSLARMAIAARGEFPAALDAVKHWLKPIEHPDYVTRLLAKSGLCQRFPEQALLLLSSVIFDQQWVPSELRQCLDEIVNASPQLLQDFRFGRLQDYSRRARI